MADRQKGVTRALQGMVLGDTWAMPLHWYYDFNIMVDHAARFYGGLKEPQCVSSEAVHPSSAKYFMRANLSSAGLQDILHGVERRALWTQAKGAHYHRQLGRGESTITTSLALLLCSSLVAEKGFYLQQHMKRYLHFFFKGWWA